MLNRIGKLAGNEGYLPNRKLQTCSNGSHIYAFRPNLREVEASNLENCFYEEVRDDPAEHPLTTSGKYTRANSSQNLSSLLSPLASSSAEG